MSVPFDVLGPGQKGRLVYQVLGQDGPIPNPKNILYLAPNDVPGLSQSLGAAGAPIASLAGATLAISGATLVLSAANLAISVKTHQEVKRLHTKLDQANARLLGIESTLAGVARTVQRIDLTTSEQRFSEALRHAIERSVSEDGIDLERLSGLRLDLEKFLVALDGLPFAAPIDFHLSTDVRDRLQDVFNVLSGTRLILAWQHLNRSTSSGFVSQLPHRMNDYVPGCAWSPAAAWVQLKTHLLAASLPEVVSRVIDEGPASLGLFGAARRSREATAEATSTVMREALATVLSDDHRHVTPYGEMAPHLAGALGLDTDSLTTASEQEHPVNRIEEYVKAWLWHDDLGLLWRVRVELEMLARAQAQAAPSSGEPTLLLQHQVDFDQVLMRSEAEETIRV